MRDQYMRCGEGFIICYSVTDRHSFQEASEYRKLIARVRLTEDIPLVLIANKLDLSAQRKVPLGWFFFVFWKDCHRIGSHCIAGDHRGGPDAGVPAGLSVLRNVGGPAALHRRGIPCADS